jgi:hypothetical protein
MAVLVVLKLTACKVFPALQKLPLVATLNTGCALFRYLVSTDFLFSSLVQPSKRPIPFLCSGTHSRTALYSTRLRPLFAHDASSHHVGSAARLHGEILTGEVHHELHISESVTIAKAWGIERDDDCLMCVAYLIIIISIDIAGDICTRSVQ